MQSDKDKINILRRKLLKQKRKNEELELKIKYLKEEKKLFWKLPGKKK